jgi:hypothetical protein
MKFMSMRSKANFIGAVNNFLLKTLLGVIIDYLKMPSNGPHDPLLLG